MTAAGQTIPEPSLTDSHKLHSADRDSQVGCERISSLHTGGLRNNSSQISPMQRRRLAYPQVPSSRMGQSRGVPGCPALVPGCST